MKKLRKRDKYVIAAELGLLAGIKIKGKDE